MELLPNLSFVKVKPFDGEKGQLIEEIKEALENLRMDRQGTMNARPAKELLDEL